MRVTRSHLDLAACSRASPSSRSTTCWWKPGRGSPGALLAAGLVDEWLLYIAPKLLGKDAKPLAALARLTRLDAAPEFELLESKAVGPDLRLRLRPQAAKEK